MPDPAAPGAPPGARERRPTRKIAGEPPSTSLNPRARLLEVRSRGLSDDLGGSPAILRVGRRSRGPGGAPRRGGIRRVPGRLLLVGGPAPPGAAGSGMWVRPLAVCWENRLLPGAGAARRPGSCRARRAGSSSGPGTRRRTARSTRPWETASAPAGAATPTPDLVPPSRRTQCGGDATGSPSRAPERAADLRAAMMRRRPPTAVAGGHHEGENGGDAGVGDPGDCGTACRALSPSALSAASARRAGRGSR